MTLWLLNTFPTWALLLIVVGGVMLLSLAGVLVLNRVRPDVTDGKHNEMVGTLFGVFGAIYGILLAFVIVILWEGYGKAEETVSGEALQLAEVVRSAQAFPEGPRDNVMKAADVYVHTVVAKGWPAMRHATENPETQRAMEGLYTALQSFDPQTNTEQAYYDAAVQATGEVAKNRRSRILQSHSGLDGLFQLFIYGGALVLIALMFLFGVPNLRMRLLFVGTVAGLVAFTLLLVIVLDRPFAGDVTVGTDVFREGTLARFWK